MQKVQVRILKDNYTGRTKIEPGCVYRVLVPKDQKGNWKVSLEENEILELIQKGVVPHATGDNYKTSFSRFLADYKVTLDNSTVTLDLKDPLDNLKYQILVKSGVIAESESKILPSSKGYIYVQEQESKKVLDKIKTKTEAFKIIDKATLRQKKDLAAILDKRTRNLEESVIQSTLYSMADQYPEKIVEAWHDPDREYKAVFKLALLEGVIKRQKGSFYYYNSHLLGQDVKSVIAFMKDEKNLVLVTALIEEVKKLVG
jgi:hypothetical protein